MYNDLDPVKLVKDNKQLLIIMASSFVFLLIIFFIYLMIKD
ncbi:MAG: hypothetical protein U9R41_08480 [Candidatus Marinimicrobia bacterium]|nr:hypothetical protein [Candidatus Neomarinimicrobiota bacterium]